MQFTEDDKTHHGSIFVLKATTHMRNSRQSENNVSHPKEEMDVNVDYTGMFWIIKGKNVHSEGKNDKGLHDEHNSIKFLRRFRFLEDAKMVLPTVIAPEEVVKKPNVNKVIEIFKEKKMDNFSWLG